MTLSNNNYIYTGTIRHRRFSPFNHFFKFSIFMAYFDIAKVESSTYQKKGSFNVKKIQLENVTDIANHQLLNKISKISGGAVFPLISLDDLVETINQSDEKQKVIHVKENLIGLISMPVILFLLFFLISLEWFLRKYNGLI